MRLVFFIMLVVSSSSIAEEICKEYPVAKDTLYQWQESDFTKAKADSALEKIKLAMQGNGQIESCGLPNNLAIIQGYVLKLQAQKALSTAGLDKGLTDYYVSGFCEFLRFNSMCE